MVASVHEVVAEMAAYEAGTAGDQHAVALHPRLGPHGRSVTNLLCDIGLQAWRGHRSGTCENWRVQRQHSLMQDQRANPAVSPLNVPYDQVQRMMAWHCCSSAEHCALQAAIQG